MPDLQYDDWGVLSPHRNFRVFYPQGARDTPLKARYEYEPEAVRKVKTPTFRTHFRGITTHAPAGMCHCNLRMVTPDAHILGYANNLRIRFTQNRACFPDLQL